MRRNWPFFKDSDWPILVFEPTAELENLAMSPSLSSPGLSYDTKFVHIGWELRSSLVGDTILGVQSEPACSSGRITYQVYTNTYSYVVQQRTEIAIYQVQVLCCETTHGA